MNQLMKGGIAIAIIGTIPLLLYIADRRTEIRSVSVF